jgi:hypothetical protein
MSRHPYLRAYLAGIAVPTVFLLVAMTVYTIARYGYALSVPIERLIVFPMAMVPNAWGLWNVLYRAAKLKQHISIGIFGGALPLLLAPGGYLVARPLEFSIPPVVLSLAPWVLPIGLIVYYLAWKHLVGFLNAELEIA